VGILDPVLSRLRDEQYFIAVMKVFDPGQKLLLYDLLNVS
jgi:hypothetical protein